MTRNLASWVALCACAGPTFGCCGVGPGRIEPRPLQDFEARIEELSERAPIGSTAVVAPPFVVIGDGEPGDVRAITEDVIQWSVQLLRRDFFSLDPRPIVEIWMFRDSRSYLSQSDILFSTHPSTPYGYFSACDDALVVNLGLGAGTLVHEIVHVFMEANFPDAPTWFDEGMASLFEQPTEEGGHIRGKTNWRLAGLQASARAGKLPKLGAMMSTSRLEFYSEPEVGMNYAMARYLLYYLQARGVLVRYYQRFHRHHEEDPAGIRSLLAQLGEPSLEVFMPKWERFLFGLSFEG